MQDTKELVSQIEALFNPASVAIVGLPQGMKTGKLFLIALLDQGFPGPIYPVNPKADEIDGLKCYPSVSAIPHPVDLAIILVPQSGALAVVKECAAKGVKGAVLFTAGFKETGTNQGLAEEREMVAIARAAGMRLLGPNCMGLYSPKSGLSFFPGMSKELGGTAIVSHSGSLANIIGRLADAKGVAFSKMISLGNESDLSCADFLTYLSQDPDTRMVSMYLEGIKDGPYFIRALKKTSLAKPVIIWKVGLTAEGGRAAASHTGALAGSKEMWDAVAHQTGAVTVAGWEAWVDAMMAFYLLTENLGDRIAIISGPGGLAVSAAEALGNNGLKLAELSPQTATELAQVIPPTGTSLKNPVDVSLTAHLDLDIFMKTVRAVAADDGVDAIMIVGSGLDDQSNRRFTEDMIQARRDLGKPFIMVAIPGFDDELAASFCRAGLPFYETAERAVNSYTLVRNNQRWRSKKTRSN